MSRAIDPAAERPRPAGAPRDRACAILTIGIALALAGSAQAQPVMREPPRTADGAEVDGPRPHHAADRRPFYVVGGVLVLGAIFWWNRRQRAELERRSEDEARRDRVAARAARANDQATDHPAEPDPAEPADPGDPTDDPDDPDAADLRAAARAQPSDQEPT